ncbi:MAG: type II toxin-antitoxin system RelB/DinJ family antitoxin [Mobiluncus sp.]|uniref:type II toxin-antitoxin system RelB/DinJ family antitoxin n=1 Tax=Mobiluncus sp. TaxID=47293 RepID=UPI00258B27E6|nr:type II toxin-antitoxin system RelB/DinJ family antitoxin [Mobiluncus sp.]MCI6584283.1 type II toxin-antitoxin system RelB/DinJ family antitoxin [Mobiluncus sp.]
MSEAETVLGELGIPMSNAIGMFLKQVVLQRGIPFEVKLPSPAPLALASLTKTELDSAIQEGLDDIAAGRTAPPVEVEKRLRTKP